VGQLSGKLPDFALGFFKGKPSWWALFHIKHGYIVYYIQQNKTGGIAVLEKKSVLESKELGHNGCPPSALIYFGRKRSLKNLPKC
jgi:hypothetical protein